MKRWFTLSKNDSAEIPRYPYSGSVTSNQKSNLEAPQYELFRSTWESLKQPNQQQQPLTMCQYLAFHETQHPLKHCDPPTFLASQMYCFLFLGLGMPQLKVTNPETGWYLANTFTFTVRPSFWVGGGCFESFLNLTIHWHCDGTLNEAVISLKKGT